MPVKGGGVGGSMPEHDELVTEIPLIEKMSTAERLKHAKKRRITQLKKYGQYEKQIDKELTKKSKKSHPKRLKKASHDRRVEFVSNIMLLEAAARNDIQEVKSLLSKNVSPDVTNEDGLTALHQCCIDDLEDMLRLLLDHGASVNAQDSEMWTPLHAAATCGHIHLCRILIQHGAELLSVNADGNMPYDICEDEMTLDFIENEMAKRGVTQEQIDETRLSTEVKMLSDLKTMASKKGDLEYRGRVMETPLHIAAANGYVQVTEFLMKNNVSINVEDDDSWQPIHAAACWGHLPVLELLVQHGADLDAKTKNGETPYDICEDIEMRERLIELKSEIAAKGQVKSRNLVRRRSTNTRSPKNSPRNPAHSSIVSNSTGSIYSSNTSLAEKNPISASVRRVSSKEKGAISFKEAMEEGRRLRESVSDNDDDDLNPEQNNGGAARKVEDVQVFMPVTDPSPKPTPRRSKLTPVPAEGNEPTPPPPAGWGDDDNKSTPAPPRANSSVKTSNKSSASTSSPPANQHKPVEIENKPDKPVKPARNVKGGNSYDNVVIQEHKPKSPPTQAKTKEVVILEKGSSKSSDNGSSSSPKVGQSSAGKGKGQAPAPSARKSAAPKPPPADNKATPSSNVKTVNDNKSPPNPRRHTSNTDTVDHHIVDANMTTPERRVSTPGNSTGGPPQGTLSDLKKQRAIKLQEKLQESLRFRDGEDINAEIKNFNDDYSGDNNPKPSSQQSPESTPSSQQQNGQNGKVQSGANNNKYGYVEAGGGDTIKKYHFSDTTSVLGDNDQQTSCCVLM